MQRDSFQVMVQTDDLALKRINQIFDRFQLAKKVEGGMYMLVQNAQDIIG